VDTLRLDRNGIDYVGANYIGELLTTNFYITSLVCILLCTTVQWYSYEENWKYAITPVRLLFIVKKFISDKSP